MLILEKVVLLQVVLCTWDMALSLHSNVICFHEKMPSQVGGALLSLTHNEIQNYVVLNLVLKFMW